MNEGEPGDGDPGDGSPRQRRWLRGWRALVAGVSLLAAIVGLIAGVLASVPNPDPPDPEANGVLSRRARRSAPRASAITSRTAASTPRPTARTSSRQRASASSFRSSWRASTARGWPSCGASTIAGARPICSRGRKSTGRPSSPTPRPSASSPTSGSSPAGRRHDDSRHKISLSRRGREVLLDFFDHVFHSETAQPVTPTPVLVNPVERSPQPQLIAVIDRPGTHRWHGRRPAARGADPHPAD